MNNIQSKNAIITGASSGIGKATALQLIKEGHSVYGAARRVEKMNELVSAGGKAVAMDVTNHDQIHAEIQKIIKTEGRIDVLVNNASAFYPTPVGSITLDDWDVLVNSNMKAPLFLAQAAAPYLKQVEGNIINMADVHAMRPMKEHPVYCAAKAGLVMITKSLAKELGPEVRVNSVAPGAILWPDNDMPDHTKTLILERTSLKKPGDPIDIAKTILFLVRDAHYITGQVIAVDGGRTLNI